MKKDFGHYVRAKQLAFLAMLVVLSTASEASMAAVTIAFNSTGLSQLNYNGYNFIQTGAGAPTLNLSYQTNGAGSSTNWFDGGTTTVNSTTKTLTRDWSGMAQAVVTYSTSGDTLTMNIAFTNTSSDKVITGFGGNPITGVRFPVATTGKPANWASGVYGNFADFSNSTTNPGVLLYVADNPLQSGGATWGNQLDYGDHGYPPGFNTGITRLLPGSAVSYKASFRFAPSGTTEASMGTDLVDLERLQRPFITGNWTDHRAMGTVFLASDGSGTHPTNNPRGWFSNSSSVDVTTPAGLTAFGNSLMALAQTCVDTTSSSNMNGQGNIVWDIEGQQYGHPISYLGFPLRREVIGEYAGTVAGISLPPEMEQSYTYGGVTKPLIDHFFAKLKTAGEVGVCLRPSMALQQAYPNSLVGASHYVPFDWVQELIDKITYAKTRWGCKIFYVDTNNGYPYTGGVFPADMFRKVAEAHPDVLLIPEHYDLKYYYYGFGAPLRHSNNGELPTDPGARALYPDAFSVMFSSAAFMTTYRSQFVAGVKKGDILCYQSWWGAPENAIVKSIYTEAAAS